MASLRRGPLDARPARFGTRAMQCMWAFAALWMAAGLVSAAFVVRTTGPGVRAAGVIMCGGGMIVMLFEFVLSVLIGHAHRRSSLRDHRRPF